MNLPGKFSSRKKTVQFFCNFWVVFCCRFFGGGGWEKGSVEGQKQFYSNLFTYDKTFLRTTFWKLKHEKASEIRPGESNFKVYGLVLSGMYQKLVLYEFLNETFPFFTSTVFKPVLSPLFATHHWRCHEQFS